MPEIQAQVEQFKKAYLHNSATGRHELDALLHQVVEKCCKGGCIECQHGIFPLEKPKYGAHRHIDPISNTTRKCSSAFIHRHFAWLLEGG